MKEVNWKELVGKRIIYKERFVYYNIKEAKVIEVSPSGDYVKLEILMSDGSKYTCWEDKYNIKLIEVIEQ